MGAFTASELSIRTFEKVHVFYDICSLTRERCVMNVVLREEMPENILQQHQEHLIRWLEEKLQRNEVPAVVLLIVTAQTICLFQYCIFCNKYLIFTKLLSTIYSCSSTI